MAKYKYTINIPTAKHKHVYDNLHHQVNHNSFPIPRYTGDLDSYFTALWLNADLGFTYIATSGAIVTTSGTDYEIEFILDESLLNGTTATDLDNKLQGVGIIPKGKVLVP